MPYVRMYREFLCLSFLPSESAKRVYAEGKEVAETSSRNIVRES